LSNTPEGKSLLSAHPAIETWLETMRARPSVPTSNKPPEAVLAA
jgi:hypothetical protein